MTLAFYPMKMAMIESQSARFSCNHCGGRYKVVHVEMESVADDNPQIACVICGMPLQAYEGKFALKYFLVSGAKERSRLRPLQPVGAATSIN